MRLYYNNDENDDVYVDVMMRVVMMFCVLALESCILGEILHYYAGYVIKCIRVILVGFNYLCSYRV